MSDSEPSISQYWNAYEVEEIISSHHGIALQLVEKLYRFFGLFSLSWLGIEGEDPPSREMDTIEAYYIYETTNTLERTGRRAGPFSKEQSRLITLVLTLLPTSYGYQYIASDETGAENEPSSTSESSD